MARLKGSRTGRCHGCNHVERVRMVRWTRRTSYSGRPVREPPAYFLYLNLAGALGLRVDDRQRPAHRQSFPHRWCAASCRRKWGDCRGRGFPVCLFCLYSLSLSCGRPRSWCVALLGVRRQAVLDLGHESSYLRSKVRRWRPPGEAGNIHSSGRSFVSRWEKSRCQTKVGTGEGCGWQARDRETLPSRTLKWQREHPARTRLRRTE